MIGFIFPNDIYDTNFFKNIENKRRSLYMKELITFCCTCQITYYESPKLRALRAHVPTCIACLRAHVLMCQRALRAYVLTC